ncbi:MAG: 3'-5' exonuclease [Saprospirales bacterium]|nr:MAG: 3'-5' exonuclease [Saprospirales bacterium]
MFLIFDASAAGVPKNWNRPHDDPFNWPRLVHLAWLHYDKTGQLIKEGNKIVKPDHYKAEDSVFKSAGLERDAIESESHPIKEVLTEFLEDLQAAKYLFAHNLQFSENVVRSECYRLRMNDKVFDYVDKYCIMREATHHCKLPGKGGRYKWPTLQELHLVLFKARYPNPNNAWSDVVASSTCLFELLKIDAIEL